MGSNSIGTSRQFFHLTTVASMAVTLTAQRSTSAIADLIRQAVEVGAAMVAGRTLIARGAQGLASIAEGLAREPVA